VYLSCQFLITLRAQPSGAVYCYRSCLCVCLQRAGGRCLLPRQLEITCIDLHQTGSVGADSDRLQLIKFWRSCAPGKGVCGGAKIFGTQCLRLSGRFFISFYVFFTVPTFITVLLKLNPWLTFHWSHLFSCLHLHLGLLGSICSPRLPRTR